MSRSAAPPVTERSRSMLPCLPCPQNDGIFLNWKSLIPTHNSARAKRPATANVTQHCIGQALKLSRVVLRV
jgi:hypothetical protein